MKKFKLKVPKYSFDHEGMIIQGKLSSCEREVEVYAIDLCYMTKLDYEMLKLLKKQGAKYICRDEGSVLNICDTEPYQNKYEEGIWWSTGETAYLSEYLSKLFQFVKWEDKKYHVIEYVLENYEIVEDE